ncbi:MAG: hypothetical protein Q9226_009253, partial [Calogaya cf. arnoldii]
MVVISISFLFRVDYTYADGIGIRLVAKACLKIFAHYLSETPENHMPLWQHTSRNFSPPWIGLVNDQQKTYGEDFENNVRDDIDALLNHSKKSASGFKVLSNVSDQLNPTYLIRSFTEEQSAASIRMVKSKFGLTCTITSISHAVFVLAMFKAQPQSDTAISTDPDLPSPFVSPLFMNGRRYLDPQTEDYTPICQANTLITSPNIKDLLLTPSTPPAQQIRILDQACRASITS